VESCCQAMAPRDQDHDIPEPGEGEVRVKVQASGICGSDIGYIYRGYKSYVGVSGPAYRGVIAGHGPAGQIVSIGSSHSRFGIGDRVLLYHCRGGQCSNCRSVRTIKPSNRFQRHSAF
jgi:threonine dehydrogenase-like Zn-dependent dehydrogenase